MKNMNLAWLLVPALALGIAACDVEQNGQSTTPEASTETEQPAAGAAGIDMQGDGAEVAEPDVTAEDTDAVAPEQTVGEAADGAAGTDAGQADEAAAPAEAEAQEDEQQADAPAQQPQS